MKTLSKKIHYKAEKIAKSILSSPEKRERLRKYAYYVDSEKRPLRSSAYAIGMSRAKRMYDINNPFSREVISDTRIDIMGGLENVKVDIDRAIGRIRNGVYSEAGYFLDKARSFLEKVLKSFERSKYYNKEEGGEK